MKRKLAGLMAVLLAAMLIASCDSEDDATMYKVTFNSNGGSDVAAIEVKEGGTATKPSTDPTKTDGVLQFWSKDGKTEFDFKTAITEDTELKAIWKTTFNVGDRGPAGGIIFYDNTSNTASTWNYLEAAPSEPNGKYVWGSSGAFSTGTAVGTGKSNTTSLLAQTGKSFPAAQACADYGNDTAFDDWFLPSKDELNAMYAKKTEIGMNGSCYWTSSETSNNENGAELQYFSSGNQNWFTRSDSNMVHPARAF